MNQAVINVKIDPKVKSQAQKVAADLGLSLSGLLNAYLRNVIRTKEVCFSLNKPEIPSARLIRSIKKAEEDWKKGNYYTADSVDDLIEQLEGRIKKKDGKKK
ncbi:MAG: type II toxin-antitoxin system RelB/DinJ family antitoxin [Patescibacteria group bacterium]|jgi:addiction module RelB/DinJ family antitoxin